MADYIEITERTADVYMPFPERRLPLLLKEAMEEGQGALRELPYVGMGTNNIVLRQDKYTVVKYPRPHLEAVACAGLLTDFHTSIFLLHQHGLGTYLPRMAVDRGNPFKLAQEYLSDLKPVSQELLLEKPELIESLADIAQKLHKLFLEERVVFDGVSWQGVIDVWGEGKPEAFTRRCLGVMLALFAELPQDIPFEESIAKHFKLDVVIRSVLFDNVKYSEEKGQLLITDPSCLRRGVGGKAIYHYLQRGLLTRMIHSAIQYHYYNNNN